MISDQGGVFADAAMLEQGVSILWYGTVNPFGDDGSAAISLEIESSTGERRPERALAGE
jgi:hypothetical protein